mmetsp:Transcript_423/g.620  ORF Transcript_423/g.620 Transcript_423/m.620 type:complete len:988 (-) Transcript_423:444-3407(-)|eukprot:CAMPEP_0171496726 /NCGR_PEP_ID=MMETSP0958-20121227/6867_1 /TAXON_ID=87120 /ORGANISM="Aurantiochytrium limacinum, Strain ATCCMYA-1381" /LENGTH=987 /DNA_ID=CAMNT_0012030871 /DNA_START=1146 /DNA_END=4109 /DNA_ORIENTATION=-
MGRVGKNITADDQDGEDNVSASALKKPAVQSDDDSIFDEDEMTTSKLQSERRSKTRNDPRRGRQLSNEDNDEDEDDDSTSHNNNSISNSRRTNRSGDADDDDEEDNDDNNTTMRRRSNRARRNRVDLSEVFTEEEKVVDSDADDEDANNDNADSGSDESAFRKTRKTRRGRRRHGSSSDDAADGAAEREEEEDDEGMDLDEDYNEEEDGERNGNKRQSSSRSAELRTKAREDTLEESRRKDEKRWKVREDKAAAAAAASTAPRRTRRSKSAEDADEDFSAGNGSSEESEDSGAERAVADGISDDLKSSDSASHGSRNGSEQKSRGRLGRVRSSSVASNDDSRSANSPAGNSTTSGSRPEPRKRGRPAMSASDFARQALKRARPDPKDLKRRVALGQNRKSATNVIRPIPTSSSNILLRPSASVGSSLTASSSALDTRRRSNSGSEGPPLQRTTPQKVTDMAPSELAAMKAKLKDKGINTRGATGVVRARPDSLFKSIGSRSSTNVSPTPTSDNNADEQRRKREAVLAAMRKQAPGVVDTSSGSTGSGSKSGSPVFGANASVPGGAVGLKATTPVADPISRAKSPLGNVASPVNAIDSVSSAKKQKRPKLRKPMKKAGGVDLSPPTDTRTSWNASEVIKGFLYVGAGWDQNQRCLVNRKNDDMELKASRMAWCRDHNMCYALNMAGSPHQRELRGIGYVLPETKSVRIDVNDLDIWDEQSMRKGFERGADFIEEAWKAHVLAKERCQQASNSQMRIVPPTIFVHCVAGVNRSPMSVVWWLCKYHGLRIRDAWELVRKRRDQGAHWTDVTLGGPPPPEGYVPSEEDLKRASTRKFQHRYDVTSKKMVLDYVPLEPPPEDDNKPCGSDLDGSKEAVNKTAAETASSSSSSSSIKDEVTVKTENSKTPATSAEAAEQQQAALQSDGPNPGSKTVVKSGEKQQQADAVRYPKALWYINAEKILSPNFKRGLENERILAPYPSSTVPPPAASS